MTAVAEPRIAIRRDRLDGDEVLSLLRQHLALMHAISPPESVHALELEGLRAAEVSAWTAWSGDELVGVGALEQLDPRHGEIKSMHTAAAQRGRGIASRLLVVIVEEARRRDYARLSLETGSMQEFAAARALYERHGFHYCGAFGDYRADPNSVFMTRSLTPLTAPPGRAANCHLPSRRRRR